MVYTVTESITHQINIILILSKRYGIYTFWKLPKLIEDLKNKVKDLDTEIDKLKKALN